ncbi:MAG: tRNA (adenosine(37)-N6)-dimethylallyltransferase MiaA [Clostridia bacterium]|nr:tRNA (adenosine(37)-N6)-dimethylallyltransferase MiaA [Clostridia bacterium]
MKQKIVVITGTTAVGKTKLSLEIAKQFGGEIVSCDSMQIYKFANIATAKIKPGDMQGIPHHMLDICQPNEGFSAGQFAQEAEKIINQIIQSNHLPIIVGGTGLYIKSLLFPLTSSAPHNANLRNKYEQIAKEQGPNALYQMLVKVDPETATSLHQNQTDRIIRALEIYEATGVKKSELHQTTESPYDYLLFVVYDDRAKVYDRINARVKEMVDEGLIEETQELINNHHADPNSQVMQAIGYKEAVRFLKGEINKDEMIELISQNTRNYAKRQITFFKKLPNANYVLAKDVESIKQRIIEFLGEKNDR